jgi:hypothetical protein
MDNLIPIILGVAVVAFFIWLVVPSRNSPPLMSKNADAPFIDPEDSYQIGLLVGMRGGTIPDAALMRFALQRFQEEHGRRATSNDIGLVLGLIESSKRQ